MIRILLLVLLLAAPAFAHERDRPLCEPCDECPPVCSAPEPCPAPPPLDIEALASEVASRLPALPTCPTFPTEIDTRRRCVTWGNQTWCRRHTTLK